MIRFRLLDELRSSKTYSAVMAFDVGYYVAVLRLTQEVTAWCMGLALSRVG
jgi:hypothetical protein